MKKVLFSTLKSIYSLFINEFILLLENDFYFVNANDNDFDLDVCDFEIIGKI
jgi:hypothetical protein